jgi:hypothetical protein
MRDLERNCAYAQLLEDVFSAFQVEIATAGPTDSTYFRTPAVI